MSNRLSIRRCDLCEVGIVASAPERIGLRAADGRSATVYAWVGRCGLCKLAHVDAAAQGEIDRAWDRLNRS